MFGRGNWPKGNVAAGWFNYFSLCRIISFIVKSHSALPCTNCFVGFLPTGKVGACLSLATLSPGKVGAGLSLPALAREQRLQTDCGDLQRASVVFKGKGLREEDTTVVVSQADLPLPSCISLLSGNSGSAGIHYLGED